MKIALVSQEFPPETAKGGIGTQNYMRAHGLTDRGHQIFVISHSIDFERHEYCDKGVTIIRIPGIDKRLDVNCESVRWLTYSTEVAVALEELHKQHDLDLVVFPEWGGEGFIYLLNRRPWNHIPTIVHIHGPIVLFAHAIGWPELDSDFYRVGRMMEETSLRLADAISASSPCSSQWCIDYHHLQNRDIPILYTGVDTSVFYPRDVEKAKSPTVIFVGGVRRNKGVDLLVRAVCVLAKDIPGLKLEIVGRGEDPFLSEIKRIPIDAGFPDLLDIPGYVHRHELPEHLSKAHVFAGPSTYEPGPGNVYLEAMGCGLPVVATQGSGAADVVADGENGILIPPNNESALVAALRELLIDDRKRRLMAERALDYVVTSANSDDCLDRLEKYYEKVVAEYKTGALLGDQKE